MELLVVAENVVCEAGATCQRVTLVGGKPYELIIATADNHGCDLIFMASHGRSGVSALLLGNETQKVLAHSKISVLAYRLGTACRGIVRPVKSPPPHCPSPDNYGPARP